MNRRFYCCTILLLVTVFMLSCGNAEEGTFKRQLIKYFPSNTRPDSRSLETTIFSDKGTTTKTFDYDSVYIYSDSLIKIFTNIEDGFSIKYSTKYTNGDKKINLKTNAWSFEGYWKGY